MRETAKTLNREDKRTLDVGCGLNKYPNAIGLDYNPKTAADVIHDLANVPYPFRRLSTSLRFLRTYWTRNNWLESRG